MKKLNLEMLRLTPDALERSQMKKINSFSLLFKTL
jgi:hypothetical protein